MPFELKNKVALISGGASGIGLEIAKQLLKNGLKGVALVDNNQDVGESALRDIQNEFGTNKVIYVKADVTDKQSYEESFKKTIRVFENLDILVNNAGVFNDALWEKEIAVNINGTIHGVLLGLENYIPKYMSGDEGVILNMSSVAGVTAYASNPVYTATKFAVTGLSKAFGEEAHYERTKVRVLALCPGLTDTPILKDTFGKKLGPAYQKMIDDNLSVLPLQKPEFVALAAIKILKNAKTGTVWVAEGGEEPYEFVLPPRESFAPK